MKHSPALRCDRVDRLGWVEQSPHYVSFIDQSVEATARLVVADRLIAPFELSEQSKLIIGQLCHEGLRWKASGGRPPVVSAKGSTPSVGQETAALRNFNPCYDR